MSVSTSGESCVREAVHFGVRRRCSRRRLRRERNSKWNWRGKCCRLPCGQHDRRRWQHSRSDFAPATSASYATGTGAAEPLWHVIGHPNAPALGRRRHSSPSNTRRPQTPASKAGATLTRTRRGRAGEICSRPETHRVFYRRLLGPLCLPSFAVCRSLASHSPVRRSKSSKSSCVARNASTSCGVGLLTICHKAADTLASFQATPVRQASSETTTWCLSVVSASPRCHPIWRTLVRARRTWISWSAWRINPTCERALFTTLLPSRAPRGGAWGMRGWNC